MSWGAAIGGAFNFAGSLAQASTARKNVNKTNKANMRLAEYQFMKNKEMWDLQNEYNHPRHQMARFRNAGLNPNLMYGMGTPGNVSNYPKYQAPNLDYTGRPNVPASALSSGIQGAYQGIQEYQEKQKLKKNRERRKKKKLKRLK